MRPFERLRYQVTLRLARRRSSCYFQRDAPRLLVEGGQPQLVHCPSGITEQYNPSRKVLQFPDVPRPLMGSQEFSFLVAQRRRQTPLIRKYNSVLNLPNATSFSKLRNVDEMMRKGLGVGWSVSPSGKSSSSDF